MFFSVSLFRGCMGMSQLELSDYKKSIAEYIRKECIYYPPKGEFFFGKMHGARYSSQFYLANLLYNQDMFWLIAREFVEIVKKEIGHWKFQIASRDWSSIPLVHGLPMAIEILEFERVHSFMIRSERKTYGRHNFIEGIPNDLPVLLVDDLCNSTNSFIHCSNVLKEYKIPQLPYIFAVLNKYSYKNYGEGEWIEYFDRYLGRDYKALSILTRDDII